MVDDRQPRLFAAKLKGLVRASTGAELVIDDASGLPGGVVAPADDGVQHGFFYATGPEPIRMLGPSVIWGQRVGVGRLHVVADGDVARDLARRASALISPITVWQVSGSEMHEATPRPVLDAPTLPDDEWALASLISEAGARPVDDHGRLVAEIAGLEVARVGRSMENVPELEVGVGQADRELHALVHSTMDADTALRRAIAAVLAERRPGSSRHPLARIARERWLRSTVLDDPSSLGLVSLEAVPPLRPRATVLGNVPSAAMGSRHDGSTVVVVCSSGIDADLVPEAADYRLRSDPDADVIIVVPQRDAYPVTQRVVDLLPRSELVGVAPPWGPAEPAAKRGNAQPERR